MTASGYLLDTNVISELMKARPSRSVMDWVGGTPEELMHLSVITIGEIRKGINLLDEDDPRRGALQSWLDRDLRIRFAGRLPAFDEWDGEASIDLRAVVFWSNTAMELQEAASRFVPLDAHPEFLRLGGGAVS